MSQWDSNKLFYLNNKLNFHLVSGSQKEDGIYPNQMNNSGYNVPPYQYDNNTINK